MSIEWVLSSCVLIVLVILVRLAFRKRIRPCVRYALWLAVALRLLLPFSFCETAVSVLNLLPEQSEAGIAQSTVLWEGEEAEGWLRQTEDTLPAEKPWKAEEKSNSVLMQEEQIPPDFPEADKQGRIIDKKAAWKVCWLFGALFLGGMILAVNLDYGRRLKMCRRKAAGELLPQKSRIQVYIAPMIETPCLFGVFCPGIYVTEQVLEDSKTLRFVLSHENMHYRHHDNWWALVRICCLCLHWYNPLVWLAAYLSGQDGELACDEKVLEGLGLKERGEYGRALLALSTGELSGVGRWRLSTAIGAPIGGGKRQLKERLQMIVKTPGRSAGALAVLSALTILMLAVTFTGKNSRSYLLWGLLGTGDRQEALQTAFQSDRQQEPEDFGKWQRGDLPDGTKVQTSLAGRQVNLKFSPKEQEAYQRILKGEVPYPAQSPIRAEDVRRMDLNFDGRDDLCIRGRSADGINVPCYCMLWKPQKQKFEYSVTLCNVETDLENQWIVSRVAGTEGESFSTYCRYDAEDRLHMIKYVEENKGRDGFEYLDLTYVDDDGPYTLQAIVDEERFNLTLVEMARQALSELYQWTGEKVETACFQVSDMGGVVFSLTEEDMVHSRIFFSRYYGADTQYNLSGYDKSISSIGVASGRNVWFSPVLWRVFPKNMENMTDEEVISWYFERIPISEEEGVKTIEQRYGDTGMWTIQAKSGRWFEVFYNKELREVSDVTGPYPELPVH